MNTNGAINFQTATPKPASPPAPVTARNGLSIDGSGAVVLGNDIGDNAADLLSDRAITTNDFQVVLSSDAGFNEIADISVTAADGALISLQTSTAGREPRFGSY